MENNTSSIITVTDSCTIGTIDNCYNPSWTLPYSLTYTNPVTEVSDITIRKVENGFIAKFQGKEYAFEKLESLLKNIDKFYTKTKDKK